MILQWAKLLASAGEAGFWHVAGKKKPIKKRQTRRKKQQDEKTTTQPTVGSTRWLPWQDRYLAQEVLKHRPFAAGRGNEGSAWVTLAEELRKDSGRQGLQSVIDRTGEACRARMKLLLQAHQVRHNDLSSHVHC